MARSRPRRDHHHHVLAQPVNLALGSAGDILGLVASLCAVITLGYGLLKKRPDLLRLGAIYTWLVLGAAVLATFAMQHALITRDFTVQFVDDNGSTRTPGLFNIATMWSALEGSILLWALILAGYTFAVARKFRRRLEDPLVGWALLIMFVVCVFFFGLMAGPANPFRTFSPPPGFDGPGPNPLLQNHPLGRLHPPMLYLGYVGFTVPFAFAIAALVTGRVGEGWLVETRRWTLVRLGLPDRRHRARRLVELRGARLGRLLGVGPGRERVVPTVAHRHRLPALGDGAGAAGDAARLEPVAALRHVLAHHPRHLPHPLGRARQRARVQRVGHRAGHPHVLRARRRGVDRAHRVAGRSPALARTHRLADLA